MGNPKVSVIIPVYNTEKYLEATLQSICNQSLSDIEIIVIDDGSTDGSAEIIERMAERDSRICRFSQSNQGLSASRNRGMDNASGDYLYFMDSDDLLDVDALERCYEKCTSQNLQIAIFDAEIFYDDDEAKQWGFNYNREGKIDENKVCEGVEMLEILLEKNIFRASACLFFVKRELLENISLRFAPGIIHEDELFTPLLYLAAGRVGYIPRKFFHRRIRANSITTNNFSQRNSDGYFFVAEQLEKYSLNQDDRVKAIINVLLGKIANSVAYQANSLTFHERMGILDYFCKRGYLRLATFKNLTILVFPWTITIKSKFKGLFRN